LYLAINYLTKTILTFANIDNKNKVRTQDCRTTMQNNCTYGSPLKHTNIKITMNIITQAGNTIRYDTRCYINVRSKANMSQLNLPQATDN